MAGILAYRAEPRHASSLVARAASCALSLGIVGLIIALLLAMAPGTPVVRQQSKLALFALGAPPPPPPVMPPPVVVKRIDPAPPASSTQKVRPAPALAAAPELLPGAPELAMDTTESVVDQVSASAALVDLGAGGTGAAPGPGAGGGGAGGTDGTGDGGGPGGKLLLAHWVFKPTPEDLRPFNPDRAMTEHREGAVLLACRVRLNHRVHDCRVLTEAPKGYGFGRAAQLASSIFRIWPPKRNGKPVDDAWVAIPVQYRLAGR